MLGIKKYLRRNQNSSAWAEPHNAELRKGSEEKKLLYSINVLKKLGIIIKGPLVSDTLFIEQYKNFDVIVGMYHDQVLSPFKTLYKFKAINLTLD